jgi:hypothetical protein
MPHRHHPFLSLFQPEAERRPPAYRLMQEILAEHGSHPALPLVMLLVAADRECRSGRLAATAMLLSLAAGHLTLDQPGAETGGAAAALGVARQDVALGDRSHCAAAIATTIFALLQNQTTH